MANTEFYWVGNSDESNPDSYWFNKPSNWVEKVTESSRTFLRTAKTAPGIGDTVWIGSGLGPTAQTPLLYGGYSGDAFYGNWFGATANSATGGTFDSGLNTVNIGFSIGAGGDSASKYPFPFVGGGITGPVWNYLANRVGVGPLDTIYTTASTRSRIWNDNRTGPLGGTLVLKVQNSVVADCPRADIPRVPTSTPDMVKLEFVPCYTRLGRTGPNSQKGIILTTFKNSKQGGGGNVILGGGAFNSVEWYKPYTDKSSLTLMHSGNGSNPLYINKFKSTPSIWTATSSVIAGEVSVVTGYNPSNYAYMIWKGLVDTNYVNNIAMSLGLTYTSYTGPNESKITLNPPVSGQISTTVTENVVPKVFKFAGRAKTIEAIGWESGITDTNWNMYNKKIVGRWNIFVEPMSSYYPSYCQNMNVSNTDIQASPDTTYWQDSSAYVKLDQVVLSNKSMIDFSAVPAYNGWAIGSITGSASASGPSGSYGASGSVPVGGILFNDETSFVKMSEGLQVYKSALELSGRVSLSNDGASDVKPNIVEAFDIDSYPLSMVITGDNLETEFVYGFDTDTIRP